MTTLSDALAAYRICAKAEAISPKTPKKNMPTFSEKELERLFAQVDKKSSEGYRDYTIMLTLLDTGIRVSELCGLELDDVDLANGYLRVMGKGQKERYVPIGPKLTKALLKYKLSPDFQTSLSAL